MSKNANMHKAKVEKNDEFYTQLSDIEKECWEYRMYFKGKTIFCNCDDPKWSNFWRYFHINFNFFGLKELISTHYERDGQSYVLTYHGENDVDCEMGNEYPLKGNGDYKSEECLKLMDRADIIVTNPPFSLFREFVDTIINHKKDFLIIGNYNAVTYKEIFPLIKDDKIRIGYNFVKEFKLPDNTMKKFGNITWFTTLPVKTHNKKMTFIRSVKNNPELYQKYDNYDAINVDKVADIPEDYDGVMGVPITFLITYNPEQFEIVSFRKGEDGKDLVFTREKERESSTVLSYPCQEKIKWPPQMFVGGEKKFFRVLIKHKSNQ